MASAPPSPPPEPLTLEQVRANLRQPPVQENDRITDLIVTAREYVEGETGLVLTRRQVTETVATLGCWIDLASWPIATIDEIRVPVGPDLVAMDPAAWRVGLNRRPIRIIPAATNWGFRGYTTGFSGMPLPPVEIDLTAGYEMPALVPMRAKHAMHMLIAHWFANRESVETGQRAAAIEVPLGVAALLDKLTLVRI